MTHKAGGRSRFRKLIARHEAYGYFYGRMAV